MTENALTPVDQLVRLRTVSAGLRAAEDRLRVEVLKSMNAGVQYGTGPVRDGKVTLSKGGEWVARITDLEALTEWVVQHYPDEVVPVIKDWFLADIKAASVKAGTGIAPGGEMVPGIEVVQTTPELKVFADRDAIRWVAHEWLAVVSGLPSELPAGE